MGAMVMAMYLGEVVMEAVMDDDGMCVSGQVLVLSNLFLYGGGVSCGCGGVVEVWLVVGCGNAFLFDSPFPCTDNRPLQIDSTFLVSGPLMCQSHSDLDQIRCHDFTPLNVLSVIACSLWPRHAAPQPETRPVYQASIRRWKRRKGSTKQECEDNHDNIIRVPLFVIFSWFGHDHKISQESRAF